MPNADNPQSLGEVLSQTYAARQPVSQRQLVETFPEVTARARAMAERAADPEPAPRHLDEELDAWLSDDMLDDAGEYRDPADDAHADQLLGVLAAIGRRSAEVQATAAKRRERIDAWEAERTATLAREAEQVQARLEGYSRQVFERSGGKTQTLKLSNGTLKLTKARTRVHVLDATEVPAWLRSVGLGGLVKEQTVTTTSVVKGAVQAELVKDRPVGPEVEGALAGIDPGFKAHHIVTDSGEKVPGVYLLVPEVAHTFKADPS